MAESASAMPIGLLRALRSTPVLLLLAAGVALGVTAAWRRYIQHERGAAVARQALELTSARRVRPVHAGAPLPGTFGDALAPALPGARALSAARRALPPEVRAACDAVHSGEQPWSTLPQPCEALLARSRDDVERALAATRAERGGLPEDLRGLRPLDDASPKGDLLPLVDVAHLAGLQVREALARGDADAAVKRCLDTLALARDVALDGMLVSQMLSISIVRRAVRPCAAALDAASPAHKREALVSLGRLEQGWPTYETALRYEEVWGAIQFRCVRLRPEQVAGLPPEAQRLALSSAAQLDRAVSPFGNDTPWPVRELRRIHACGRLRHIYPALIAAARLPGPARDAALLAVDDETRDTWNPLLSAGGANWVGYGRRLDERQDLLRALRLLAETDLHRADAGAWPLDLRALGGRMTLRADHPGSHDAVLSLDLSATGEPPEALQLTADAR